MIRSVTVLGAGNGGHAAAADLTLRGYEVRLYSRSEEALAPIREKGGISIEGAAGEGLAEIALVTNDIREAIQGADLVMTVVPTTALEAYAELLAGELGDGQPIFINPGQTAGGLFLCSELRRHGFQGELRTCEASTLTYGCRIQSPGHVKVVRVVPRMPFAAFPGKYAQELYELVSELYPAIELRSNVLETGLANLNAVEHPPQTLLNVGWLEHTAGDYFFYYEGTTPGVGRVIDALDRERLDVADALGIPCKPFVEAFFEAGYTTAEALKSGSAYQALHESEPNRFIKGPKSLDHRYIHEDVGHGLVAWAALGDLAGVATPVIDSLILLATVVNGRDYLNEGLTLERLGLAHVPRSELDAFLHEGTLTTAVTSDAN